MFDIILGITSDLVTSLSSGEEFLPALGRALSGNLISMFIGKLLNETLGVPQAKANEYGNKTVAKAIFGVLSGDLDIVDVLKDNLN